MKPIPSKGTSKNKNKNRNRNKNNNNSNDTDARNDKTESFFSSRQLKLTIGVILILWSVKNYLKFGKTTNSWQEYIQQQHVMFSTPAGGGGTLVPVPVATTAAMTDTTTTTNITDMGLLSSLLPSSSSSSPTEETEQEGTSTITTKQNHHTTTSNDTIAIISQINKINQEIGHHGKNNNTVKYLQYFAQAGWSNQLVCLVNAYYIARSLNLILILPPMLPHRGRGSSTYSTVANRNHYFYVDYDFRKLYNPSEINYVRMDQIIDVEYSLPNIPGTIDFLDFVQLQQDQQQQQQQQQQQTNQGTSRKIWTIEENFTHFNTHWIYQRPDLEGKEYKSSLFEFNSRIESNVTYREIIPTLLRAIPKDVETIQYLNTFKARMDDSVKQDIYPRSPVHVRYHKVIRQVANTILDQLFVPSSTTIINNKKRLPYASIHLRGAEGHFRRGGSVKAAMQKALSGIGDVILDWAGKEQRQQSTSSLPIQIGLYVATDMKNLRNETGWQIELLNLKKRLDMEMSIWWPLESSAESFESSFVSKNSTNDNASSDEKEIENERKGRFQIQVEYSDELWQQTTISDENKNNNNNEDIPDGNGDLIIQKQLQTLVRHLGSSSTIAGLILDQQLAGCADIGFRGTAISTFSDFIHELQIHRQQSCL